MNELESDVERRLVKGIKKIGGIAFKFVSPGNSGVPDRIVALPDGVVWFVELKRDKGRLTKNQSFQQALLSRLGHNVITLYGMSDVDEFLQKVR